MKLLIHDLESKEFEKIHDNLPKDITIVSNDGTIHNCIGCFDCWLKTPATCIIRDKYGDMGELLSKANEIIIVSKCCYGGFSPFVKNVLDRSISYVHPYFVIKNGEMHHRRRYKNNITMQVLFYGADITEKEKHTAENLVKANCLNLQCEVGKIRFINNTAELEGQLL